MVANVDTSRQPALTEAPTQVVAHRGASEDVPEHTLAAYQKALQDGADALECDVRLTADGVLVCVHDRTVNRTSNGRGVVSTLELADLAALDFGSWRDPWPGLAGDEEPDRDHRAVLTLERLLELAVDWGRPVTLAVETKHPTRYAGLVERRLVDLLDRFGLAHGGRAGPHHVQVRVMSFATLGLRRVRALAPRLPTVLLLARVPLRLRDGSLPTGTRIAGPSIDIVRAHPEYVAKVHARGHAVHVWTVDDPADVALCARLGVEAIITNRPRQVRAQLAR
ncbi:MAG: glycerophosphodiester phosphodiesterase family protein [Actinomycetota bacterium]